MNRYYTRTIFRLGAVLHVLTAILWAWPQSPEVPLRQITLASEQEAREVRASLSAGASFEAFAVERSRDANAPRGGYVGRMRLSDLRSEIRQALEPVTPGKVTDPVRLGGVYVLFQVVPEAEAGWIDLDEAGAQALVEGRNAEAATHFEKALAQAESAKLGDARLASSLDSLADVYRFEGRVVEAEKLYVRALALLERMGAPKLEIAQVLNGMGMSLAAQSRFSEAEGLYERARSIRADILGPNHPEVAAVLRNLAELEARRGSLVKAANLFEKSQALLEAALGSGHPAAVAGAQSLQAFRRSLLPELLERFSIAASLAEFRDREFDRTMTEIRELLPLAPLSERSYVQMKDILLEVGLTSETEEVLRAGLSKFPDSRILRIYLADLMSGTGRTQNALGVLQEAGRLPQPDGLDAPTDRQQQAIIHERIGDIQSALNNFDDAVAAYRRALEVDPALSDARLKLSRAYFSNNLLEEAQSELERAIREGPNSSEAHLRLSETFLASGQWERSAAAAERSIELGASDSRALYLLGTALVRMGRVEEGQKRLREFAKVEASLGEAEHRNREITATSTAAIGALRKGDGAAAVEQLTEGVTLYPDAARLRMNLAMVQSRLGQHQMAAETLESMLKLGVGRRFLIHKNLADEYEILGDLDASRRHRKIYLETREAELIVYAPE